MTNPDSDPCLDALFRPRSVAVIGASRNRESIGWALLHNLVLEEFHGAIFPVNPSADVIHSLKCYPNVGAIPDPVDLAFVVVPKRFVEGVVEECLAAGIRGLVVITAGFTETGEEGARLERRIRDRVRAAGARMIGPNCMGIINTDPEVRLNGTFAPTGARRGSIGFLSQSGALGVAILIAADALGIGLTQFASMGNKADVSANDLVECWEHDDETRVIAMYLESFGNPRRFTEIAKRVGRRKPILMVKSGRTAEGARAASSHTGAIAGADVTVSAFLEQCGVIRVNTIEELFGVARALDRCPLPGGNRVAIVTNAGGPAIMATDACVNLGLEIPELSATTQERLAAFLPSEASLTNPVDMIASATELSYEKALQIVLEDPEVDIVMAIHVTPLLTNPIAVMEGIGRVTRNHEKPVLAVVMASESFHDEVRSRTELPPVYRFPEPAAGALARVARYAAWRRRPAEEEVPSFEVDLQAVAALIAQAGPDGYLPQQAAFELLVHYGIPVAPWRVVRSHEEALAAAELLGYPVVVKGEARGLVHKSDIGAVHVDLRHPAEMQRALSSIDRGLETAGLEVEAYLVQGFARGGHEVIFGLSTDPRYGPLLMFGLGGKYVEVIRDVRFGVLPLLPSEARDMIQGISGFDLLQGVRGERGADLALLEEILLRLAQLALSHPEILELDINPFVAAPERPRALAIDARVRIAPAS